MENDVKPIGLEIFLNAKRHTWIRLKRSVNFSEKLIQLTAQNRLTKVRILQFTSLLPSIHDNHKKIIQNLVEYFNDEDILLIVRLSVKFVSLLTRIPVLKVLTVPLFGHLTVFVTESVMARRFFVGENIDEALKRIEKIKRQGRSVTVDVLGDVAHSKEDTDQYVEEYIKLLNRGIKNISLKLTNLYSEFSPNAWVRTKEAVKQQLNLVIEEAKKHGAQVTIDMENFVLKDLTIEIFLESLANSEYKNLNIAIQTYFKADVSNKDLEKIVNFSRELNKDRPKDQWIKPGIRLVKGSNWDKDMADAIKNGWDLPHFEEKHKTDINFEDNVGYLLKHLDYVRVAFASHNIRSIACAIANARKMNLDSKCFEFQFLYGMIPEEIVRAIEEEGYHVRFYTPYGDFVWGLGYLVRRILENSSNASFIYNLQYDKESIENLLKDPREVTNVIRDAEEDTRPIQQSPLLDQLTILKARLDKMPQGKIKDIFHDCAFDMRDLLHQSKYCVQSLPGERNEYIYYSRGKGLVIFDDMTSEEDIAYALALVLVSGNSFTAVIPNKDDQTFFTELLDGCGVLKEKAKFIQLKKWDYNNYIETNQVDWIMSLCNTEQTRHLRKVCFDNLQEKRKIVHFISQITPDTLKELLITKSVCENTMHSGFAEDLYIKGGLEGFANIAPIELYKKENQMHMAEAISQFSDRHPVTREYPLYINKEDVISNVKAASTNPAKNNEVIGTIHFATEELAQKAVDAAEQSFDQWSMLSNEQRAEVLVKAAEVMKTKRFDLAALIVAECGKTREEALLEVDEGIDFLNYYSIDAARIEKEDDQILSEGRLKNMARVPNGVVVVISPWNFPLALLTGMTAGALVMGNTVIMKPAEQTSIVAFELTGIFVEAGIPKGVLNFVSGEGEQAGEFFVKHDSVDMICFTGSKEVGLHIKENIERDNLSREHPKSVIAEMGGKNAIIVDEDGEIDEAVHGIIDSAFGYSGQKCSACSRVIVLNKVRGEFEEKLKSKFYSIIFANPNTQAEVKIGPLIENQAKEKINEFHRIAKDENAKTLATRKLEDEVGIETHGNYTESSIYKISAPKNSRLACEEIFGPILSVIYVKDFKEAVSLANESSYALTGGVYSQTPSHIKYAKDHLEVGNLYINRKITGALVGRQPFGGLKLSGIGAKTGGPDYLRQFTHWIEN